MNHISLGRTFAGFPLLFLLLGCGQGQQAAAPPPPAVTVAPPVKRSVIDRDEYVGRFVAVDNVEVRARVSGTLDSVHFQDGQVVNKGDLLFTIDKRPFQNTLDQGRANLVLAKSNLTFAEGDLQRAMQLVRDRTITEQVFDQRSQTKRNAEASVNSAEAAVRQGELDLAFTEVRAPLTGRIGDRRVAPGNVVTSTTTLLATIVSTDPIRFEFTLDEASFLRYVRMAREANLKNRGNGTEVKLKLIDEKDFGHEGKIDFVDNVIDRSTGTIRGRAEFANPNTLFTPGMFARIQVPGSQPYETLLLPDAVLGSEQARKFVFVVGDDNAVKQKYVETGQLDGDLRVIRSGIEATDRVVVNGMAKVRAGVKVNAQEEGKAPPPAAAAAPAKAD